MTSAQPAALTVATTAPPTSIPFRKNPVASGPEMFGMLLVTVLLLAAFAAAAWYARRRGWLDRWIAAPPAAKGEQRRLAVLEVLPLSRKTTVFRIRDGEREFLVAESMVQIQTSFSAEPPKP